MRRVRVAIVSLSLFLMLTAGASASEQSAAGGTLTGGVHYEIPDWFKNSFLDIHEDVADASDSGRHVLLFMHLDECPYCATMLQETFTESAFVDQIRDNFDCIAINVRGDREVALDERTDLTEKQLAELLEVRATPTLLFLDEQSNPVLRIDGYRSPRAMETALEYVRTRAYKRSTLADYQVALNRPPVYALRDDPLFVATTDLSAVNGRPVAVLFEDRDCDECDPFHERQLQDPEIRAALERFAVVRLDAQSDRPLLDPEGRRTTPRAWARELEIDYRPSLVLFDDGREIIRVDSMLNIFHLLEVLLYVADEQYGTYPVFRDFARTHRQALLDSGASIDVSK